MKKSTDSGSRLRLPAVGLEAELSLYIDDMPAEPETVFGTPRAFIRGELLHRVGTSYQLQNGAAVYFDTGVIEVATPIIELERGCMARAGRSLWESIAFIRGELDAWEQRTGHRARLAGFSTHYNVSIDPPSRSGASAGQASARRLDAFARLLTYVLPAPVMLLATNRESTGVGVRPRGDRIEMTADFTLDPTLMVAAGSLITGIIREMATWPSFDIDSLRRRGLPRIRGFTPMPHTSRKGWLARFDCYPSNPFTSDADLLRPTADRIFSYFRRPIARVADPFSLRLIGGVLSGRVPSCLDLHERPPEYEDVGRPGRWEPFYSEALVERSRLEQIVMRALSGDKLRIDGIDYTPPGMQGWSRIVFRRDGDGQRRVVPLDDLLEHLPDWGH
ncbi:MAG: hypothetical protein EXQ55_10440 [Acidobacteria bacterium]|nr:hypothetical protein [Acidobacteriota bacterium]